MFGVGILELILLGALGLFLVVGVVYLFLRDRD